jgi:hypothetical protein
LRALTRTLVFSKIAFFMLRWLSFLGRVLRLIIWLYFSLPVGYWWSEKDSLNAGLAGSLPVDCRLKR